MSAGGFGQQRPGLTPSLTDPRATVITADGQTTFLSPASTSRFATAIAEDVSQTPIVWQDSFANPQSLRTEVPSRVQLSDTAARQYFTLSPPPLDARLHAGLISQLQAESFRVFGEPVAKAVALAALELSCYQPGTQGQPSAPFAFSYLRFDGKAEHPAPSHPPVPPAQSKRSASDAPPLLPFPQPPPSRPRNVFFRKALGATLPQPTPLSVANTRPSRPHVTTPSEPFAPGPHISPNPPSPVRLFRNSASSPTPIVSPVSRCGGVNFGNPSFSRVNPDSTPTSQRVNPFSPLSLNSSNAETVPMEPSHSRDDAAAEFATQFMRGTLSAGNPPLTPPPRVTPHPQSGTLFQKATRARNLYDAAAQARRSGVRQPGDVHEDVELAVPLSLASDLDTFIQRSLMEATALVPSSDGDARCGVPEEVFEQAWEEAARSLAPIISEASGASQEEVEAALVQCDADCSVALLSILHQKGDSFQQACAQASLRELQRQRQGRSLETIVQEAALQGGVPPDLSSRKLLRMLKQHLPLTEIMGHRYRTGDGRVSFADHPQRRSSSLGSENSRVSRRCKNDSVEPDPDESDEDSQSSDGDLPSDEEGNDSSDDDYCENSESDTTDHTTGSTDKDSSSEDNSSEDSSSDSKRKRKRSRSSKKRGSKSSGGKSNLVATPPPDWMDGDPPLAGFYLETFTNLYGKFRSFTNKYKDTGLQFKDLISADIEPTVLMELGLTEREYRKLSQDELIQLIKKRLGFNDDDYYARKLEVLKLPSCKQSSAIHLMKAFRKLTSPFLKVLKEAKDSGVRLRYTNVSRIFKNQIRGCIPLERWFLSKKFKNFSEAVRFISSQIHDRIAKTLEADHDEQISEGRVAGAAGARSDFRGGKAESGQATPRGTPNYSKANKPGARPADPRSPSRDSTPNRRPPRSDREEAAFQAALAKEKELPLGMYYHVRGPFCRENPCKSKICQGCNYHADADGKGHIRPNCRCKDHPDFVKTGYFHEAHPGHTGALSLPKVTGTQPTEPQRRPPPPAKVRNVAGRPKPKDEGRT